MERRVVITGIGIVAPAGIGKDNFWNGLKSAKSFVKPITRFDASLYPSRIAGHIEGLNELSQVSGRLLKKIDDFSHFALVAADFLFKDAQFDIESTMKKDPYSVGIFFGNAIGGWLFAETELRDMYVEGREGVSPYLASAWFPAAPQGQVSIHYGIKGFSKTFIADRASSLMAIGYALRSIRRGRINTVLAGGTEAPVTPYALLCCNTSGILSRRNDEAACAYRPFDKTRDGLVIAEGAGIVLLEELSSALKRNAKIYAEVVGFATNCDGVDRINGDIDGEGLCLSIKAALDEAGLKGIDYVCLDAEGTAKGDYSETCAIKKIFGSRTSEMTFSAPKSIFGNLLGASGAVDLIISLLSMQEGLVIPTINYKEKDDSCNLDYTPNTPRQKKIESILINSRGRGGINTSLVIRRFER